MKNMFEKIVLIVLDGFGLAPAGKGNPITSRNMPFLNSLISSYPTFSLAAAGLVVGLEWSTYGNSEVGHSAMGTGRIVVQNLTRINIDIKNGDFFKNEQLLSVIKYANKNNSKIHLVGCVSPGGIHSHEAHLQGLLSFLIQHDFDRIRVHMITDGEDCAKNEAIKSLTRLEPFIKKSKARVASVIGRTFGMDRVKNWALTKEAYDAMVHGKGEKYSSPEEYLKNSYKRNVYDAEIKPAVLEGEGNAIEDKDGIIFFNFRNDRMKQIIAPLAHDNFKEFNREHAPENLFIVTMTNYGDNFGVPVAYPTQIIPKTLGEIVSRERLKQLRVAESEKEAHVTNFFSGGIFAPYAGEDREIAPSRVLDSQGYLDHPGMSLHKITESIVKGLHKPYSLIIANFANSDMVAHTGNIEATKKALTAVDKALEEIIKSADLSKTVVIITADHGNAEELISPETGEPDTLHSTSNVPVICVIEKLKNETKKTLDSLYQENPIGSLIDIAPTVLHFLGIKQPSEMPGIPIVSLE